MVQAEWNPRDSDRSKLEKTRLAQLQRAWDSVAHLCILVVPLLGNISPS